nr:MAG TPA: hypothetical protein [Caudoviricetes sp.]
MVYAVSIVNDVHTTAHIGVASADIGRFIEMLRERIAQHPGAGFSVNFGGVAHLSYTPFCGCIAWGLDDEICAANTFSFGSFDETAAKFRSYI